MYSTNKQNSALSYNVLQKNIFILLWKFMGEQIQNHPIQNWVYNIYYKTNIK